MMTELVIFRYVHFIAIFAIVGAIFAEQFLISNSMSRKEIKLISKLDAIYGIGVLIALAVGIVLWFWVGKPASLYSRNWIFHTKLTMFIGLVVLSIYPIIFFYKNRKGNDLDSIITVPKTVIVVLRIELLLILIIPALASMVSLGIGIF